MEVDEGQRFRCCLSDDDADDYRQASVPVARPKQPRRRRNREEDHPDRFRSCLSDYDDDDDDYKHDNLWDSSSSKHRPKRARIQEQDDARHGALSNSDDENSGSGPINQRILREHSAVSMDYEDAEP